MNAVTITGLTRVSNPKPNKGGSTVLAFFDCQSNGFMLQGCAFVRTPRHGLTVWPPKLDGPESARRSVTFADEHLRQAMIREAQAAYRALGGTDGEWMPRDNTRAAANFAAAAQRIREKQERQGVDPDVSGLHRFLANGSPLQS